MVMWLHGKCSTKTNFDVFKSLSKRTRKFFRLIATRGGSSSPKSYPFCGNFTYSFVYYLDVFRIFSSREVHLIESFSYEPRRGGGGTLVRRGGAPLEYTTHNEFKVFMKSSYKIFISAMIFTTKKFPSKYLTSSLWSWKIRIETIDSYEDYNGETDFNIVFTPLCIVPCALV